MLLTFFEFSRTFLTFQLTSVALHGSSLHPAAVYISDLFEHIILLPKRNIPLEIMMERFTFQDLGYLSYKNQIDPDSTCLIRGGGFFSHVVFPQHLVFEQLLYFT